jgi:hypothetical protein
MPRLEVPFCATSGEFRDPNHSPSISLFKSLADPAPLTITLAEFISSIAQESPLIAQIRALDPVEQEDERARLKRRLPAVTVSGAFSGGHKKAHLVQHSGLMCIDFDAKDNPQLKHSFDKVRDALQADEFSHVTFTSAGGDGLAVIVRIDPANHLKAFLALEGYYADEYGLTVDKACKDVCRLRFVSSDPDITQNANSRTFRRYRYAQDTTLDFSPQESSTTKPEKVESKPKSTTISVPVTPISSCNTADTITPTRAQEITSALSGLSPDRYEDWIQAGMAIHSEHPGECGLKIWTEWSEKKDTAGKFSYEETLRKWRSFGQGSTRVNLNTIFKLAYEKGWEAPAVNSPLTAALSEENEEQGIEPLPVIWGHEWAEMPEAPREPILEGIFDKGDMVEVVAPSKTKKSFFTLCLGLACATGAKFLDWAMTKKHKVLIFNLEIKPEWMHRRFRAAFSAMRASLESMQNVGFCNTRGLDPQDMMKSIVATVRSVRPDVVIIDPLYMTHDGDENSAQDVKPLMRSFMTIMAETGTAVVFVHHDAKGKAGDRNIRDRGAGSGLTGRAVDARITLTPHADNPELICVDAMPRNFPHPQSLVASFDGCFKVERGVEVVHETSRTSKSSKGKKSIDLGEVAQQALNYIQDADMRENAFTENVLQDSMGLGINKAKEVKKHMRNCELLFRSRQYQGGYWVGTKGQISARNKWIAEQRGEV